MIFLINAAHAFRTLSVEKHGPFVGNFVFGEARPFVLYFIPNRSAMAQFLVPEDKFWMRGRVVDNLLVLAMEGLLESRWFQDGSHLGLHHDAESAHDDSVLVYRLTDLYMASKGSYGTRNDRDCIEEGDFWRFVKGFEANGPGLVHAANFVQCLKLVCRSFQDEVEESMRLRRHSVPERVEYSCIESDESSDSDGGFPLIIHWHVITNHSFVTAPEIGFNYSSMTPLFEESASGPSDADDSEPESAEF